MSESLPYMAVRPDSPSRKKPFFCGVVEGFYGRPWINEQRHELFRRMKKMGMNTYLYAPKDDSKHRMFWREKYSVEEAEELAGLISAAQESDITFVYALSPGIDMVYSSKKDLGLLKKKLDQLAGLGCKAFSLLFDDIEPEMCTADKEAFKSFAEAQVFVTNTIYEYLDQPQFIFCPTEYCASRADPDVPTSQYLNEIGSKLLPDIEIMWTGPKVISKVIPVLSIVELTEILRRPPLIWDNIHANDYDPQRLFLGPFEGRSPKLIPLLRGVLTNPNCEFEANFVAMHTLATWSRSQCPQGTKEDVSAEGCPVVESDVQLETEDEPILPRVVKYDGKAALRKAVTDWLPQFYVPRAGDYKLHSSFSPAAAAALGPSPSASDHPTTSDLSSALGSPLHAAAPSASSPLGTCPPGPVSTCMATTPATQSSLVNPIAKAIAHCGSELSRAAGDTSVGSVDGVQRLAESVGESAAEGAGFASPFHHSLCVGSTSPTSVGTVTVSSSIALSPTAALSPVRLATGPLSPAPLSPAPLSPAPLSPTPLPDVVPVAMGALGPLSPLATTKVAASGPEVTSGAPAEEGSEEEPMEADESPPVDAMEGKTLQGDDDDSMSLKSEDTPQSTRMSQVSSESSTSPDGDQETMQVDPAPSAESSGSPGGSVGGGEGAYAGVPPPYRLTEEDLLFICELFYLPYQYGDRGMEMLSDLNWLHVNVSSIRHKHMKMDTQKAEVWHERAQAFYRCVKRVSSIADKLFRIPNKSLSYDLCFYVLDIRAVLSLLQSFIKWLESTAGGDNYKISEAEPWAFRGGLTGELQRLLPMAGAQDLFAQDLPLTCSRICTIRPYLASDEEDVYKVCLKTCDDRLDGSPLFPACYSDLAADKLVGHFLTLSSQDCFVIEDDFGCCGYALGALNAKDFRTKMEVAWLPAMRAKYSPVSPGGLAGDLVRNIIKTFHSEAPSEPLPETLCRDYPSLVRVDVLASRDMSSRASVETGMSLTEDVATVSRRALACLLNVLRAGGSRGAHCRLVATDTRSLAFYTALGFTEVANCEVLDGEVVLGRKI